VLGASSTCRTLIWLVEDKRRTRGGQAQDRSGQEERTMRHERGEEGRIGSGKEKEKEKEEESTGGRQLAAHKRRHHYLGSMYTLIAQDL